ncbi:unnamed protein product, partial [Hapterophycus canaliculatus]
GGWRCEACLVSNPESALKCLSCETAKPGEEGKVEAGGAGLLGGSSGASSGGFTFGSPVGTAAASTGSETAAAAAAVSSSVATNAAGGFTFGAPPAPPAAATVVTPTSSPAPPSAPSLETNAAGGFAFGASVPEPSGSTDGAEPVDGASATRIGEERRVSLVQDDGEVGAGGGGSARDAGGFFVSDGSDDEEKREEEKILAEEAFDEIDGGTKGWVEEGQLEALMEAVGTTYSAEDLKPKLLSICTGGRLARETFLAWYMEWLYGDQDSSDEDGGVDKTVGASGAAAETAGFASLLKSQAGGWRCDACLVSNPESALKCLSCEAAKPGEEVSAEQISALGGGVLGGSVKDSIDGG